MPPQSSRLRYVTAEMEEAVDGTEGRPGATEQAAAPDPLLGAEASSSDQSQPGESVWGMETPVERPAPAAVLSRPSEDKECEQDGGRDRGAELGTRDQDSVEQVQPAEPRILQASRAVSSCTQKGSQLDGSQVGEWDTIPH